MSETEPLTTAAALVEFHRELTEADLPPEIVSNLMSQAGHALMNGNGYLAVRNRNYLATEVANV